ncbi:proline--tRNA ligase [Metamycoplasma hyosynoviae]|uniref:proline--tRNA ligase n=1 Tax=Metamycoplasma hyosynoviae TaxID=29559 RepID=UPI0023621A73|nr:proline--tRNA ligase [Metamycoplasma hyosynoviae]MDD1373095.1 proline--tRNA ligase [Metamycoplasma hyosynoviae]MDD7837437.1 proline--tRNA ligase [Metamycoplasma hyosynoviae]MDD7896070.1 proline--tRNA ligase [Metamycoplasma hyosynoviae]
MKKLEKITPQNENFAKWFTDVIQNGDLMAYGASKGSIIFKPLSFGIWDNIRKVLDEKFKSNEVQNVYLPLLIPESLLQKEKDHLQGFNPELATVTEVGGKKLTEKYFIRPTSETLFGDFFKNEVESHNDLPLILNQWANVMRWEKTTNPFLRTREFLWQEGHTIHSTEKEAVVFTKQMLQVYCEFVTEYLAIPVISGEKTPKEKFSGAEFTFTIEAMMKDGKALQSATSHYLGQNFTKVFDVKFKNKNNEFEHPYGTSWGTSTRLLGAIIMTHGDDRGIIVPPKIAPIQIDIIEILANKNPKVHEFGLYLKERLSQIFLVNLDTSMKSPGFKAANSEIHGTPLRIEVGPLDVEQNQVTFVRRDTLEKFVVSIEDVLFEAKKTLENIQNNLYTSALNRLKQNFVIATNYESFKEAIAQNKWVVTNFACNIEDEIKIKEETGASSRCIPFEFNFIDTKKLKGKCFFTNKKTDTIVIFARAY